MVFSVNIYSNILTQNKLPLTFFIQFAVISEMLLFYLSKWPVIRVYLLLFKAYFMEYIGSYGLFWIGNETLRESFCLP